MIVSESFEEALLFGYKFVFMLDERIYRGDPYQPGWYLLDCVGKPHGPFETKKEVLLAKNIYDMKEPREKPNEKVGNKIRMPGNRRPRGF